MTGSDLHVKKKATQTGRFTDRSLSLAKTEKWWPNLTIEMINRSLIAHHETTVLPEFIEWENFRLNRKSLILTNLSISPRKQECVVVTFEDLIERAKAHLIELQKGNKI